MSKANRKIHRRDFLKTAGLAGGAAAVAAVAVTPKSAKSAAPEAGKSSGYRETEHIRKYFESARM